MFAQILDPTGNLFVTWLVALIPLLLLLFLLAVLRLSAWLATLIGSLVTLVLGLWVWKMPLDEGVRAYLYGSATGVWNVDWITFWGVMLFNTLVTTGSFDKLRRWLAQQGTRDVRVQTILFAWAFGALLEGLVGFGYPWAFVAPILIALGIPDLDAIRVAAIANNAPVSYGALGAPIIALATVTAGTLGMRFRSCCRSTRPRSARSSPSSLCCRPGSFFISCPAAKACGRPGRSRSSARSAISPDNCRPPSISGPICPMSSARSSASSSCCCCSRSGGRRRSWPMAAQPAAGDTQAEAHGLSGGDIVMAWLPIAVLVVVVVAWTGPWSGLPSIVCCIWTSPRVRRSRPGAKITAAFNWTPFVGGTAILASWIITAILLRVSLKQVGEIFAKTWSQMWGACLVGVFIFGLAYVFNYSGMAGSLASAFSKIGPAFIVVAPILGFIGVALSGSNTSTNAMFGTFQALVGKVLGFPLLLLPTLNSVGAEVGKPIAPQTASVGVSTSRFVRNEGEVIRHNFGWCLVLLAYLVLIGVACYLFFPSIAVLPPTETQSANGEQHSPFAFAVQMGLTPARCARPYRWRGRPAAPFPHSARS